MHHSSDVTDGVRIGLTGYFLLLALINGTAAAHVWIVVRRRGLSIAWGGLTLCYLTLSITYLSGVPLAMPPVLRNLIDRLAGPVNVTLGVYLFLFLALRYREWLVRPTVAWVVGNVLLAALGFSLTDADFRLNVGKPDNVPIVGMCFLLSFFTWLGIWKAVRNDRRVRQGRPLIEQEGGEKVLVWPDLVYTELIAMVLVTVLLVSWAIVLEAPLEQPANAMKTPNPSKAPWYFVGLQELLIYFDPWFAGVVLPGLIILGLMALPYIDFNKQGNGYYTFSQRKFAISAFLFGFLGLWVTLIMIGTFLRGPNQSFFGPFEQWDVHKLEAMVNVNLSEYFWIKLIGRGLPDHWLFRESPGILLLLFYLFLLPHLLAVTVFRRFVLQMGILRFVVLIYLLLIMTAVPIKMLLFWTFHLKYVVTIPEFFFNI